MESLLEAFAAIIPESLPYGLRVFLVMLILGHLAAVLIWVYLAATEKSRATRTSIEAQMKKAR